MVHLNQIEQLKKNKSKVFIAIKTYRFKNLNFFKIETNLLTWNFETSNKSITSISHIATANRTMINRLASSIDTANSWTRIYAFAIFASTICRTIGTNCTFWSAHWWSSHESRQTRTDSLFIRYATLTVQTARKWTTRISWFCYKNIYIIESKFLISYLLQNY